jgi:formamidopyrimidine-DNA glycosylase
VPELPEVEVLRRSLSRQLTGDRILRTEVREVRLREKIEAADLARRTEGREVLGLRRRSKYLLIDLAGGETLVVHLGMSGRLTLAPADTLPEPHEHVTFTLASGGILRFRDPRRFGVVFATPTEALATDPHFAHLGIEPLAGGFDGATLAGLALGRRGPVKSFLMDGRLIVGVGNIYASESLFRARIHPLRSVARISRARWDRLAAAVVAVLEQAIAQGGTTLNDFADGLGQSGYFQVSLSAYGRAGEPCMTCGSPIRRLVQAGRSTFYCPSCQR